MYYINGGCSIVLTHYVVMCSCGNGIHVHQRLDHKRLQCNNDMAIKSPFTFIIPDYKNFHTRVTTTYKKTPALFWNTIGIPSGIIITSGL